MEYSENRLNSVINSVTAPDRSVMDEAERRQARLAKPPGSLGRLEELAVQLCGIRGRMRPTVENKYLLVFCSDNGVTEEQRGYIDVIKKLAKYINDHTGKESLAERLSPYIRLIKFFSEYVEKEESGK